MAAAGKGQVVKTKPHGGHFSPETMAKYMEVDGTGGTKRRKTVTIAKEEEEEAETASNAESQPKDLKKIMERLERL